MKQAITFLIIGILLSTFNWQVVAQQNRGGRGQGTSAMGPSSIAGHVLDAETKEPLIGANVRLKSETDSIMGAGVTDERGDFTIVRPRVSRLIVEISYIGYLKSSQVIDQRGSVDLGEISLMGNSNELGEVLVEGQVPVGEMKGDTAVFNADAFKTKENGYAEDLIKKIPGVVIENGKIQAQGEDVQKVLVDGREFFGNDPNIALKNLPSNMIDQVEILDQKSDQSRLTGLDDGNYAKTINIITKGNMRNGYFGRVYGGYGNEDRYSAGGNINLFNGDKRISIIGLSNNINQQNFSSQDLLGVSGGAGGGSRRRGGGGGDGNFLTGNNNGIAKTNSLGLNYSDKWGDKMNFTGSYFFNHSNNGLIQKTNTETVISEDKRQYYQEDLLRNTKNENHRINAKIEYDINESNSLIISPSLSWQNNKMLSDEYGLNLDQDLDSLSAAQTGNSRLADGYNISNNLTYRYKFDKQGRTISTNIYTGFNKRDQVTDLLMANRDFVRSSVDTVIQQSNALSDGFNYRANITYTEPLSEKSIMSFDYQIGNNKSAADQKTFVLMQEQNLMVLDTALSNEFDNKFTTQKAGVGYRFSDNGLNVNFNVDYQNAQLNNHAFFPEEATFKRSFNNVLPNASIMYRDRESGKNIRFRYRTSTNEPSVNQLQNVINNNNPLQLSVGNPNLGQSYNHNFFMNYGKFDMERSKTMFLFATGSFTNNYIGTHTYVAENDTLINGEVLLRKGGQITQPVNLSGNWNARLFFNYGTPLEKLKSNLNLNSSVSYNRTPGMINNEVNYNNNIGLTQRLSLTSNISKDIDFTVSTATTYNIVKSSLQSNLDNNYYQQNSNLQLYYSPNDGKLFFNTTMANTLYTGLSEGFDQSIWLWNIEGGYRFLKDNKGELKLTIFDILGQNQSVNRSVSDVTVSDVYSNVLTSYGLVTFTYIIGKFKKSDEDERGGGFRRFGPPPGGARSW
ncbi:outer membrane beta-barrel protein [Echinicola marina]|uniref:outer membrane beta-barrel protein n=1 Tax=Echinicola marina TaxID=2859768 RepID=UPI001CF61D2C|nr:outer membrane beta-barrel protein [Echinicola marina]UCS94805.1 outer membrane beta-barrel protein [Echinicola marina]